MRRMLVAVLVSLLLIPTLPARSKRDWENVKKLKIGAAVEVSLWTGESLSGEVESVSDTGMQVAAVGGNIDPRVGWLRDFDRRNIRSVARVREHSLPDSKKWMIAGTLAGGAVGVTTGAVRDAEHGIMGVGSWEALPGRFLGSECRALRSVRPLWLTPRGDYIAGKLCTRTRGINRRKHNEC